VLRFGARHGHLNKFQDVAGAINAIDGHVPKGLDSGSDLDDENVSHPNKDFGAGTRWGPKKGRVEFVVAQGQIK